MYSAANKVVQDMLHNQLKGLTVSANTAPQLLHLTSLVIFQSLFQIPLYISGKFVPVIITEIKPKLDSAGQELLEKVHLSIVNNERDTHLDAYHQLKALGMTFAVKQK